MKLPPSVFGNPSSKDLFFVFEAVNCLGNETDIFDCELSPWGVEGCDQDDVLTISCSDHHNPGHNFKLDDLKDESYKITNALSNLLGLPKKREATHLIPTLSFNQQTFGFCFSDSFGDLEASYLCQSHGYECGVPNFDNFITTQNLERNGNIPFLTPFFQSLKPFVSAFASLNCTKDKQSGISCHYELEASCQHTAQIICFSKCPVGLHLSKSGPVQNSLSLDFRETLDSCTSVYVGEVMPANQVRIGENVLVSASITADEEDLEDDQHHLPSIETDTEPCKRRLTFDICQCLPWQMNQRVERVTCSGQESLNCSLSVRDLWLSVGGHCR